MNVKALSALEKTILKAKGLTDAHLKTIAAAGVRSKDDFRTVGDATTLAELSGASEEVAQKVMSWALGADPTGAARNTSDRPSNGAAAVETADVVNCIHCKTKQPKDYKSGDPCPACGKQAEPVLTCFWCSASGPGKFCRRCGAEFVPTGELELALLLKREGIPKQDVPGKLRGLKPVEKEQLWGRVRRSHG
jgi:hypothetical protein